MPCSFPSQPSPSTYRTGDKKVIRKIRKTCESVLGSAGLRRTRPRIAILSALLKAGRPITQEQIAQTLSSKAPNKVTIYRTLETLVEANVVHKAYLQEKAWHFELARNCTESQCHPHFTCADCGSTFCMTELNMPMAQSPHKGFIIQHQQVRLEGLCPGCADK